MSLEEHSNALRSTLEKANLVPGSAADLIPANFSPTTKLNVAFNGRPVELGNLFRASECKTAPAVSFEPEAHPAAGDGATYMLLLIDPDAPTPDDPKFAFWRHWVVSGLKPTAEQTKLALTEYLGPGPKDDSKPHRYLFLLFREPSGLALAKEDVGGEEFTQRRSFDAANFVKKNNLTLVSVSWMLGAGDGWTE